MIREFTFVFKSTRTFLEKLVNDKILNNKEKDIIMSSLCEDSLAMPFALKDKIRAKAFKNVLIGLMKR